MKYLVCPECSSDNLDYARDCSFDGMQHHGWQIWCYGCTHTWQGEEDEWTEPNIKPDDESEEEQS